MYAIGPCKTPKLKKNKRDPKVHNMTNLRGLSVSTGKRKNPSAKQTKDPIIRMKNPAILSNRLNWNHDGSSTLELPVISEIFSGSTFCAELKELLTESPIDEKNEVTFSPAVVVVVCCCLQEERNSALSLISGFNMFVLVFVFGVRFPFQLPLLFPTAFVSSLFSK